MIVYSLYLTLYCYGLVFRVMCKLISLVVMMIAGLLVLFITLTLRIFGKIFRKR